jgi:hypothetical protein
LNEISNGGGIVVVDGRMKMGKGMRGEGGLRGVGVAFWRMNDW